MCIRDSYQGDYDAAALAFFRQADVFYAQTLGRQPVSYTHLDVYKRQLQKMLRAMGRTQQRVKTVSLLGGSRIAMYLTCLLYTSRCV